MDADILSDPEKWMESALSKFNRCPHCRNEEYIIFEGCAKCGYKNRFAEHALFAIPGSMASFAAWDTMFTIENVAKEIEYSDASKSSAQGNIESESKLSHSFNSPELGKSKLSTSDEIFEYLLSQRENQRRDVSERYASLIAQLRQSYGKLSQTIQADQLNQFTAFNKIEDAVLFMTQKALLVQGVLIDLCSLIEMDIDTGEARKASRKFLSVLRADIAEYQDASKDLLNSLKEARKSIFNS